MDKIKSFFYGIKTGIKNLIKWTPVIWRDRDWDQYFFYVVLHFKLKRMEKLHRNHSHLVNGKKYADQIKLAVLLLDRIIKDNYLENVIEPHEKKWGQSDFVFTPLKDNKNLSSLSIKVEKANTPEEKAKENKERMALYKHSDDLKNQDLDMLFKHIRKYIEGWWD